MGDIKSSLGVILNSRSPWSRSGSVTTATTTRGDSSSYFTTVFKSAKEKASNIKWPQLDFKVESSPNVEEEEEEEVLSKGEHMVEIGECNVCGV
ncbi:hypothetical protein Bca4012_034217 [Brassica carinata]|uniref:(rape) hypothetical protein n=1 Tax=Brassica napus TaxID=3708 RepID=A0A816JR96_BRANA|nr:unnamed protein product [Brassica napus]